MILQLYTSRRFSADGKPVGAAEAQPVSQAEAVFNATNESVLEELASFARGRTQGDSALRENKYLMDADLYVRFVAHAMVRRLMEVERARTNGR